MLLDSFNGGGLSLRLTKRVSPVLGVLGRAGKAETHPDITSSWDFQASRPCGCSRSIFPSPQYPCSWWGRLAGLWVSRARGDPRAELRSSTGAWGRRNCWCHPRAPRCPAPALPRAGAHRCGRRSPRRVPPCPSPAVVLCPGSRHAARGAPKGKMQILWCRRTRVRRLQGKLHGAMTPGQGSR